jgi:hypothetical protein
MMHNYKYDSMYENRKYWEVASTFIYVYCCDNPLKDRGKP